MATANEKLLNKAISDALYLQRLTASEREKVRKLLTKMSATVRGKLAELPDLSGMSEAKKKRTISKYIKECEKEIGLQYSAFGKSYTSALANIVVYQAARAAKDINAVATVSVAAEKVLTAEQAQVLVSESWLNGKTVSEMLENSKASFVASFKEQVRNGYAAGETNEQIMRRLRGYTGKDGIKHPGIAEMSRKSAERMVRTSCLGIANDARWRCYDSNSDILQGVMWVATLDGRTCVECAARDGKMWDMDRQAKSSHEFPFVMPPKHQNCRCTLSPILKRYGDIKSRRDFKGMGESTRASMDGQVPKGMDFEEWFGGQSADTQTEILGKGRYKMWKDGKISFAELVDQNGRGITVKELKKMLGEE